VAEWDLRLTESREESDQLRAKLKLATDALLHHRAVIQGSVEKTPAAIKGEV